MLFVGLACSDFLFSPSIGQIHHGKRCVGLWGDSVGDFHLLSGAALLPAVRWAGYREHWRVLPRPREAGMDCWGCGLRCSQGTEKGRSWLCRKTPAQGWKQNSPSMFSLLVDQEYPESLLGGKKEVREINGVCLKENLRIRYGVGLGWWTTFLDLDIHKWTGMLCLLWGGASGPTDWSSWRWWTAEPQAHVEFWFPEKPSFLLLAKFLILILLWDLGFKAC